MLAIYALTIPNNANNRLYLPTNDTWLTIHVYSSTITVTVYRYLSLYIYYLLIY